MNSTKFPAIIALIGSTIVFLFRGSLSAIGFVLTYAGAVLLFDWLKDKTNPKQPK